MQLKHGVSCATCKHVTGGNGFIMTCKAFPDGIPDKILSGDHKHIKPFKGDKGIQFIIRDSNKSE